MFGAVAYLYQYLWEYFGEDEFKITIIGTFLTIFVTLWGWSLLFTVVDLYQWPQWMIKYKIQPKPNTPVDKAHLWKAYKYSFFNSTVVTVGCCVLLYPLNQSFGLSANPNQIPSVWIVIRDIIMSALLEDLAFYYAHRAFHYPPLYKRFHKLHHEWTAPVGIVSFYVYPIEHIISRIIPLELGPLLCGSHLTTRCFWYFWSMAVNVIHHSGYHLPFFDSSEFHDFHHLKCNVNYGGMPFLDRWHGTDYMYEGSVEQERHFSFYSLTKTIRDLVPDRTDDKAQIKAEEKKMD